MNSINNINFLNWNARSLKANENEFFNYLQVHNVHIAIITETFLKSNVKLKSHPYYVVHRFDRITGAGGGVAIVIHRRIKHQVLPSFNMKVFECLGIEVNTGLGKLTVVAAYLPFQCTGDLNKFLKGDLQKLTRNRNKFLIIGDFNAKHRSWNNSQSNSNGKILFNDSSVGYSVLSPNGPTCFSSARNPSTIDLVLTDQAHICSDLVTHADFDSDHLPVTFSLSQEAVTNPISSVFNYHKANWDRYKSHIENNLNYDCELQGKADIDVALEDLCSSILNTRNFTVPKVQVKYNSPIIDDNLQLLIRLKNVRRRQYQRSRDPAMKIIYQDLQKEIKRRFTILRNENFSKMVEEIKPYTKPFWKLSKVLKKPQKPIPPLKDGDRILLTNQEKAQQLARQFESVHNFNLNIVSPIEEEVLQKYENIHNQNFTLAEASKTNLDEIKAIIKKFKNMKAPDDDGIFYILLKRIPETALGFLVRTFNKCLELAYFPDRWKNAKVIPILKPDKDPAVASSYRPISLLSSISKLFERRFPR